jgi:hypothetical protein
VCILLQVGSLTSLNRARGIDFKGAEIVQGTVLMVIEEKNLSNPGMYNREISPSVGFDPK